MPARSPTSTPRRICFVSGTRAEFGLMRSTLSAIQSTPALRLQIVLTGMHLDRSRGRSLDEIRTQGWHVDRVVQWPSGDHSSFDNGVHTGRAMAALASIFRELQSDVVLVVGDRVEAFAAAAAGHICRLVVAHVHGGDRALGQVDDSLRHAITKLAHLHFPATLESARRIRRLGEDSRRIHRVGSPGLDGIRVEAGSWAQVVARFPRLSRRRYALLLLHPSSTDCASEHRAARAVLAAVESVCKQIVIVYPNNDPGSGGIAQCWDGLLPEPESALYVCRDLPRALYLAILRDSAMLVGNSSSGIIEAATFGTPVIDIGPRQTGRERSGNVFQVACRRSPIRLALQRVWQRGHPRRWDGANVYGAGGAGRRIAKALRSARTSDLLSKLIAY